MRRGVMGEYVTPGTVDRVENRLVRSLAFGHNRTVPKSGVLDGAVGRVATARIRCWS